MANLPELTIRNDEGVSCEVNKSPATTALLRRTVVAGKALYHVRCDEVGALKSRTLKSRAAPLENRCKEERDERHSLLTITTNDTAKV